MPHFSAPNVGCKLLQPGANTILTPHVESLSSLRRSTRGIELRSPNAAAKMRCCQQADAPKSPMQDVFAQDGSNASIRLRSMKTHACSVILSPGAVGSTFRARRVAPMLFANLFLGQNPAWRCCQGGRGVAVTQQSNTHTRETLRCLMPAPKMLNA